MASAAALLLLSDSGISSKSKGKGRGRRSFVRNLGKPSPHFEDKQILQTLDSSGISRATIKERFKSFNTQFKELHAKQSQWTVPDQELRESLRLSVAGVLLLAYRAFFYRFRHLVDTGRNPQNYIQYSPEEVDQLLGQFFEGQQWAEQKR